MRISVILVNLNGEPFIHEALSSLERQSFRDFETIVVDNGSSDGSPKEIRRGFPAVRLIELAENRGFAYACARGWKESRGEEIAVLNNDAAADPNWLSEMVRVLDSGAGIGAIACRVMGAKSGKLESGGIYPARNGMTYLLQPAPESEAREIFGVCGVAALYRGAMLKELGFYPEDFFIYYEDADLAYRMARAGWKSVYCPSAKVQHLGSATTAGMKIKDYYLPRNKLRTLVRNWPLGLILKCSPWLLAYECASFWGAIFSGKSGALKARLDFLRLLPKDLAARREIFAKTASGFKLEQWISREYPGLVELWKARR